MHGATGLPCTPGEETVSSPTAAAAPTTPTTPASATPPAVADRLVVALSSRALFDFEAENRVFEAEDDHAYMRLQLQRQDVPARPGVAFSLARKLLAFNAGSERPPVEVVILSRNDPVSGLRVFHSCRHYGLAIERGVFTRGEPPWRYLAPLGAQLFLSAHADDIGPALAVGVAAARVLPQSAQASGAHPRELRIAFDGDAVLFSDEAEQVFQREGLGAFQQHEAERAHRPLPDGPFKPVLQALIRLRDAGRVSGMRVRSALVTARSAPAHERAIRTLMNWGLEVDEAMFLGGRPKAPFLHAFEPDLFFDDQSGHVEGAAPLVPAAQVAAGPASASASASASTPAPPRGASGAPEA